MQLQEDTKFVDVNKLLHDLRGPLINVEGLHGEIQNSLSDLRNAILLHANQFPEELHDQIMRLLNDDLLPCGQLMNKAVEQMHSRLDRMVDN